MDLVAKHSDMVILQIKMDASKLRDLLCKVDSVELIPVADEKGQVNLFFSLKKSGGTPVVDGLQLFSKKLFCPPPPGCHMGGDSLVRNPVPDTLGPVTSSQ